MKNVYIEKVTSGGVDWHDISTTSEFLKQNGRYEIQEPAKVIAEQLHQELTAMKIERDGKLEAVLADIPSLDAVKAYVLNKQGFTVMSVDGNLEATWDPEKNQLLLSFYYGQMLYEVYYLEKEIEAENVVYLAVENFLCPSKGFDSVQRFYHKPFKSLQEAETALEAMETHTLPRPPIGIRKELFIADREALKDKDWFRINSQITEILTEHPELDDDEHFHFLAKEHLNLLKSALGI